MANLDIAQSTTTNLANTVDEFAVAPSVPDQPGANNTYYDYPDAKTYLGYYKDIPEIRSAIKALAIWTCGKGYTTDTETEVILENITGWGEDSFETICQNLIIQKKILGDGFCEIIRNDEGTLINLKPLWTGNMRVVVGEDGLIDYYEYRSPTGKVQRLEIPDVLHVVNDRIANEIHGISVVKSLKAIIDAKNEALSDERKIRHRELALGVLEVDTEDATKIGTAKSAYQTAVNNGEVLVLPKGVAELKDNPNQPRDRIQWLQYLDNLFYQVCGVPKVMVSSEGYTEAGGKIGFLTFEPVYTAEQMELERDLWNQVAIKVTFNRPPSLSGMLQESEDKNTGQTNFQPSEVNMSMNRQ